MCKVIVALADDSRPEVVRLVQEEAGFISNSMNAKVMDKFAKESYDEDNFLFPDGKHIQLLMDDLFAQDPVEEGFILNSSSSSETPKCKEIILIDIAFEYPNSFLQDQDTANFCIIEGSF